MKVCNFTFTQRRLCSVLFYLPCSSRCPEEQRCHAWRVFCVGTLVQNNKRCSHETTECFPAVQETAVNPAAAAAAG